MSVLLREDDTGVCFGFRWSMTRAVGTCLDDMHYAVFAWIAANIERVCSHQNASHRFYTRVKLYLSHLARAILRRKRLTMTSLPRNSYNCRASSSSHKLKFAGALKGEKVAPVKSPSKLQEGKRVNNLNFFWRRTIQSSGFGWWSTCRLFDRTPTGWSRSGPHCTNSVRTLQPAPSTLRSIRK